MSRLKLDIALYNLLNDAEKKKYDDFFKTDSEDAFINDLIYKEDDKSINFKGKKAYELDFVEAFYLDKLRVSVIQDIVSSNIMKKIEIDKIIKNSQLPPKNINF